MYMYHVSHTHHYCICGIRLLYSLDMCVPFLGDHIICIVVVSWVLCLLRQVAGCTMDELDLVGLVSLILGLMVGMVVLVVPLCLYSHVLLFHPHLH